MQDHDDMLTPGYLHYCPCVTHNFLIFLQTQETVFGPRSCRHVAGAITGKHITSQVVIQAASPAQEQVLHLCALFFL